MSIVCLEFNFSLCVINSNVGVLNFTHILTFFTFHGAPSLTWDGAHHPSFPTNVSIPFTLAQSSITWLSCALSVKSPWKRDLWSPDPLHLIPPLGSLPAVGVRCPFQMIKLTDWRSVCCRDLNHHWFSVGDYYQILDPVWPEDIGQLVPL